MNEAVPRSMRKVNKNDRKTTGMFLLMKSGVGGSEAFKLLSPQSVDESDMATR